LVCHRDLVSEYDSDLVSGYDLVSEYDHPYLDEVYGVRPYVQVAEFVYLALGSALEGVRPADSSYRNGHTSPTR